MEKKRMSYRAKRKLQQKIVFGILAAVLSMGLIASSIVWTLGRSNVPENVPSQDQPEATAAELEEKAKANPKDVGILVELAQAYQRENNAQKAVETYEKAVSLDPGRDNLKNRLAGGYITVGQYDRAVKLLEEVLSRNPDDKEAHYYYGHALVAKKDYKKALGEFERYVKLAGENDPEVENVKRLIETLKPLAEKQQ